AAALPVAGQHVQQVVAISDLSLEVHEQYAVAVDVEGDADIGAGGAHVRGEGLGVGRTDPIVDVGAVRFHADGVHARAQLAQHQRAELVGGAVGAVHGDAHAGQVEAARHRVLARLHVAADGVAGAHG